MIIIIIVYVCTVKNQKLRTQKSAEAGCLKLLSLRQVLSLTPLI